MPEIPDPALRLAGAPDLDRTDAPLPGLEPPARGESALEVATRRTIAKLYAEAMVDERHSMLLQLMLDLAAAVAPAARHGKASAAALAAAQLRECYVVIIDPPGETLTEGGEGRDPWDELAADLRSAAAVRDPAEPGPVD